MRLGELLGLDRPNVDLSDASQKVERNLTVLRGRRVLHPLPKGRQILIVQLLSPATVDALEHRVFDVDRLFWIRHHAG